MEQQIVWNIRQARLADIDVIVNFQQALAQESEGLALEPEVLERGILQTLLDAKKGTYWMAEVPNATKKDKPVGMLMLQEEWSDWRCQTVLWIHSVYVKSENRRQGVFQTLYNFVKARMNADTTIAGIRLFVEKENKNAIATYENLGMNGDHYHLYEQMRES